jgi:death-on-curing family protein
VKLQRDTVWLTQAQIAALFGTQRPAITKHLNNIFASGELKASSVCSILEHTAADGKTYTVRYYSLDAVLSVGYRVNSKRATQFRIWATTLLRQHLLKGYTLNQRRLKEKGLKDFEQAVALVRKTILARELSEGEAKGLLDIITGYAQSWLLLQKYDTQALEAPKLKTAAAKFDYDFCVRAIGELKAALITKREATSLFGQEQAHGLTQIIGSIIQTYGKRPLYPSIEEKAAHLLYFIIKDHPFVDGNKRIGSFLFIVFLARHKQLFNKRGEKKINDNALVALALLIAESDPRHKSLMVALVMHFLAER